MKFVWPAFLFLSIAPLASAGLLDDIKFRLEVHEIELDKPIENLNAQYVAGLERLKTETADRGDLKALLVVEEELKTFRSGIHQPSSGNPGLARLQSIYTNTARRLERERKDKLKLLYQSTLRQLDEAQGTLTKAAKIEEAQVVDTYRRGMLGKVERLMAAEPYREGFKMRGKFHLMADDGVRLHVNGEQVYRSPSIYQNSSQIVELAVGDRLVAHLHDTHGGHNFIVVFASEDKKHIVSFRRSDFREMGGLPSMKVGDFELGDFDKGATKPIQGPKPKSRRLKTSFKHRSEYAWGNHPKSILAAIITPEMCSPAEGPAK